MTGSYALGVRSRGAVVEVDTLASMKALSSRTLGKDITNYSSPLGLKLTKSVLLWLLDPSGTHADHPYEEHQKNDEDDGPCDA